MNFSSTNFPRSHHASRDTVTRSRQAVTTVITFLPSFHFVFLSHNQVTILIAFAFLTLDTALSPARFIQRKADPSYPLKNPLVTIVISDYPRGLSFVPGVDLNSFSPAVRTFHSLSISYHSVTHSRRYFIITSPRFFVFYRDDDNIATSAEKSKRRSRKAIFLRESQTIRDVTSCQFSLR